MLAEKAKPDAIFDDQKGLINIQFPEALEILFKPKRYKVLWGGRGAGRSWGVARALLLIGAQKAIRVLCVRELQNSIAESVHKLLSDQIEKMGLSGLYDIEVGKIKGRWGTPAYGTTFSFEGIKNNTTKIKSYEGIDYCWVEEANKVSKASWEVLIPTIREAGSEIWITFNPELRTDYTYKRFVLQPSAESYVVKMTWADNPWFPEVLLTEKEDLRIRDPDAFLNVWEGHCREMLQGAVFAKEIRRATNEGRITNVPWDRETPVDTFWDLGRRDMTCIWFAQKVGMQWRVLHYFEDSGEDIHHYLRYLQSREYIYGTHYLPHDARNKRLGEKRSIEQIVRQMGYKVQIVQRTKAKVNAINAARIVFPTCWFDEVECEDGLNRLRHYKYKVVEGQAQNGEGMLSEEPEHDENSHGADAFMTLGQGVGSSRQKRSKLEKSRNVHMDEAPGLGWMG